VTGDVERLRDAWLEARGATQAMQRAVAWVTGLRPLLDSARSDEAAARERYESARDEAADDELADEMARECEMGITDDGPMWARQAGG
jgi:hypothetical protein